MFIDRVAQLGLLEHDPQSNILTPFPLPVRKKLIHEITQCLLPNPTLVANPSAILTSPAHVRWAMEVIGQGFGLPIDQVSSIRDSISVYEGWLLEREVLCPAAVREWKGDVEQRVWQTIFEQFSLLFQPRPRSEMASLFVVGGGGSSGAASGSGTSKSGREQNLKDGDNAPLDPLSVHVDLCHRVLRIITTATWILGPEFTEETWIVLLKVLIGITDCLLREPVAEGKDKDMPHSSSLSREKERDKHQAIVFEGEDPGPRMADELCEHLIRVLVEVWLRSGVMEVYMWDHLKRYFTLWTHRVQVINQWNATILGLTQRVANLLYGSSEGAKNVYISVGTYNIALDPSPDFVYYAWHRMIYMIGNPNALPAVNFEVAIKGISKVVNVWLAIGESPDPLNDTAPGVPDGNTLLHMFGAWLFEACPKIGSEYAQGKAEALGILCRIFCTPQRRHPFLRTYLERFYTAIKEGLRSTPHSLTSIILSSPTLFTHPLTGLNLLIPDFIIALKRILPNLNSREQWNVGVEAGELRRGAYRILGCFLGVGERFDGVEVGGGWELYEAYASRGAGDEVVLGKMIRAMYSNNSPDEKCETQPSAATFKQLKPHISELLLTSLANESIPANIRYLLHLVTIFVAEDAAFCPGLPALVIRIIQEKIVGGWPPEVIKTAFQTLNTFAVFYKYIRRDNKSCPRELTLTLCRYITTLLNTENLVISQPLISLAYEALIRWSLLPSWLSTDRDCHNAVIATLCRGITILDRDEEFAVVNGGAGVGSAFGGEMRLSTSVTMVSLRDVAEGSERGQSVLNPGGGLVFGGNNNTTESKQPPTKKPPRNPASKLIPKLRPTHTPHSTAATVSTGTRDAGLGLPTFANLTAEMMIKGAAEMGLAALSNQLGNFPPFGEMTGVSRVSTIWNEWDEVARIVGVKRRRKAEGDAGVEGDGEVTVEDYRRYIRYYAFDHRIIIGIVETPHWAASGDREKENQLEKPITPGMTLVFRDSYGKFSWMCGLKYVEESAVPAPKPPIAESDTQSEEEKSANPPHFHPAPYPYTPNTTLPTYKSPNETSIPALHDILPPNSESAKTHHVVRTVTERQVKGEKERVKEVVGRKDGEVRVRESGSVDLMDMGVSPHAFRLFLAQLGYFNPDHQTRTKLWPLDITESLLTDLKKIDRLPERECMTMTVLFCRSSKDTVQEILNQKTLSRDFVEFLHCLGWPVDLSTHIGFKGNFTSTIADTVPYFASRNVEVVFQSPYFLRHGGLGGTVKRKEKGVRRAMSTKRLDVSVDNQSKRHIQRRAVSAGYDIDIEKERERETEEDRSQSPRGITPQIFFQTLSADDHITIIWIEDVYHHHTIKHKLLQSGCNSQIFLFVSPCAVGGYLVRILGGEEAMSVGPLTDGTIISRHTLGMLVRTTAIAGHRWCRSLKGNFRRPAMVRRHQIEELCNRHKANLSMAGFYADLFT